MMRCCALASSGRPAARVGPADLGMGGRIAAADGPAGPRSPRRARPAPPVSTRRPAGDPAGHGRTGSPAAHDELIPPLFADLGDLGWDLAVVGRLDLQPRVTVVAVAGSLSVAVFAVTPPGRLALHGPVVPAGVPGDLMAQVGDLPRLAALATGDVHCVCSFRRWARGGSAGR